MMIINMSIGQASCLDGCRYSCLFAVGARQHGPGKNSPARLVPGESEDESPYRFMGEFKLRFDGSRFPHGSEVRERRALRVEEGRLAMAIIKMGPKQRWTVWRISGQLA
jgi:hypothetical protein